MTDAELKKILREEIKPIHGEIARLARELSDLQLDRLKVSPELRRISTDLSRMDSTLDSLKVDVDDIKNRLGVVEDKQDSNTVSLMNIEATIKMYDEMYNDNKRDIKKLKERTIKIESKVGISSPD